MIALTQGATSEAVGNSRVPGFSRGDGQHNPAVAQGLGQGAAIRPEHGDAVGHRLDGDQSLGFPPERGHQADLGQPPELPGVGGVAHETDVAVPTQVEAAVDQRPLRPAALDHQQGDVGAASSEFVGDPREGVDPLLDGRVDEGDVTRLAGLGPDAVEIHDVRHRLAFDAQRLAIIGRRESGRRHQGIHVPERVADPILEIMQGEDDGRPGGACAAADLRGEAIPAEIHDHIRPELLEEAFEQPEELATLGLVGLVGDRRPAPVEQDRYASGVEAIAERRLRPGAGGGR